MATVPSRVRILLVDDHAMVRRGMRDFLEAIDTNPIPSGDPRAPQLTEGWGVLGIAAAMYDQGSWGILTDALRAVNDAPGLYTFWDYQAGAWQKDNGIRIDHLLLSPQAADRLTDAGIDRHVRSWEKPSDHVPVYIDLDLESR